MRRLTKFEIGLEERGFVLTLRDDGGQASQWAASAEVMEQLIDALDDLLGEDAAASEETYQKPLG